jgi:hypothetical protein
MRGVTAWGQKGVLSVEFCADQCEADGVGERTQGLSTYMRHAADFCHQSG